MKRVTIVLFLTLIYSFSYATDDRNEVTAALQSATVYRSGAELVHTTTATLKTGNNEIVINGISNSIDSNSLQIKAPSSVTILHFAFSKNYLVNQTPSRYLHLLQDSLEQLQNNITQWDAAVTNTKDLIEVLKQNRNIKGEQNGLSVAELQKLMDYYAAKSAELQNTLSLQTEKRSKAIALAETVKQQIKEENKKNISQAGRLTLQVNAALPLKANFTISYIAKEASWTPFYDVKADNITQPLQLIYKAKIVQTTGIDWNNIKLSLSTATPSQKGSAPDLNTWFLGYISPAVRYRYDNVISQLAGKVAGVQANSSSLNEVVVTGYGSQQKETSDYTNNYQPPQPVYIVDGNVITKEQYESINPNTIKNISKLKAAEAKSQFGDVAAGGATVVELKGDLPDYIAVANKTLDAVFDIDIPFTVPTNGKEQTALIQTVKDNTIFQHYSVPKRDNNVYLTAKISDWASLNLLPGEANMILEGTYIGKTFINPDLTTDTLLLTMGQDKRVVVKRKQITDYSSVKFWGSNKQQKFTYEISVRNNKADVIDLIIKDQFPVSTNKEIEVELADAAGAAVNKETGLLTWQLGLQPNETRTLRFVYTIKYPKDRIINLY